MQAPNKKAAPFSFHRCVLFVIFKPNFPVDSPNSNFHFFPRCYGGQSARRSEGKTWGMRLNRVLVLRREQRTNNSYRMLRFESFVFTF